MAEKDEIEEKLNTVTRNYYAEIGEFINEYLEKDIVLLKDLYKKCKNWLDENEIKESNDDDDDDDDDNGD